MMADTAETEEIKGRIIRLLAGFYYVTAPDGGIYECKAKGSFRNDGIKPLVGDFCIIRMHASY
jgi:ribosome biogenesis GTPase